MVRPVTATGCWQERWLGSGYAGLLGASQSMERATCPAKNRSVRQVRLPCHSSPLLGVSFPPLSPSAPFWLAAWGGPLNPLVARVPNGGRSTPHRNKTQPAPSRGLKLPVSCTRPGRPRRPPFFFLSFPGPGPEAPSRAWLANSLPAEKPFGPQPFVVRARMPRAAPVRPAAPFP